MLNTMLWLAGLPTCFPAAIAAPAQAGTDDQQDGSTTISASAGFGGRRTGRVVASHLP